MSIAKGIALITGSAQGVGRSIALRLARDGFDISLNDLPSKRDQLRAVANDVENVGRRAHLVSADITVEDDVKGMVCSTAEELGGLDVVSTTCKVQLALYLSYLLDGIKCRDLFGIRLSLQ